LYEFNLINNNKMDILVLLMLMIGIIFISISWFKNELQCPPPKVIYKYIPANVIDTQFSKENLPTNIYGDMFNNDNVWVGGTTMSMGKTVVLSTPPPKQTETQSVESSKQTTIPKPVPYMSMTPTTTISPLYTGPITKQ
jgi:hypothetical protein